MLAHFGDQFCQMSLGVLLKVSSCEDLLVVYINESEGLVDLQGNLQEVSMLPLSDVKGWVL
jgi:hypothetical protein